MPRSHIQQAFNLQWELAAKQCHTWDKSNLRRSAYMCVCTRMLYIVHDIDILDIYLAKCIIYNHKHNQTRLKFPPLLFSECTKCRYTGLHPQRCLHFMPRHGGADDHWLITTESPNDRNSMDAYAHQGTRLGANHLPSALAQLAQLQRRNQRNQWKPLVW